MRKKFKGNILRIISEANENECEIILPHDVVVASEFVANANFSIRNVTDINSLDMILDIGPSTCDKIMKYSQFKNSFGMVRWCF